VSDIDVAALAKEIKESDAFSALDKARELAALASERFEEASREAKTATDDPSKIDHIRQAVTAARSATTYGDHVSQIVARFLEQQKALESQLQALAAKNPEVEKYLHELRAVEKQHDAMTKAIADAKTAIESAHRALTNVASGDTQQAPNTSQERTGG